MFWPLCMSSLCCGLGCAVRGLARNTFELYAGVVILGCGAGAYARAHSHLHTLRRNTEAKLSPAMCFKSQFYASLAGIVSTHKLDPARIDRMGVRYTTCLSSAHDELPIFCLFGIAWLLFVMATLYCACLRIGLPRLNSKIS